MRGTNNKSFLVWGSFFLLTIINYWPTFKWMIWRFEEANSYSTHGYLIPFIAAWLAYKEWKTAPLTDSNPSHWGILIILFTISIHLFSGIADISSISGLSILSLLYGFLLLDKGWLWVKKFWFPIAFLFFMIPLPDFIISGLNFKLKFWASDLAATLLNQTGLIAIREGSFMLFENAQLAIGDVCSGLRSLLSLVALGVLYTWLIRHRGIPHIIAIIFTIIPAAVLGNGLRIFLVSYLVHWFGESAVFTPIYGDYDLHLFTGFVIFAGAFGCLFGVQLLMDKIRPGKGQTS